MRACVCELVCVPSSLSFPLLNCYVLSIYDDLRPHAARSYTSSHEIPFFLISALTLHKRLESGIILFSSLTTLFLSSHRMLSGSEQARICVSMRFITAPLFQRISHLRYARLQVLYGTDVDDVYLRDNYRWFILPNLNPDGYEYATTTVSL